MFSQDEDILSAISKVDRPVLGKDIPILIFRVLRHYSQIYMEDLMGEKASNIVFLNAGKELGKKLGEKLHDNDLKKYLENISNFCKEQKIGILKIIELTDNKLVVQLDECITCAGMDNIGKRICYFETGLVAGLVEHFLGNKKVIARETKCNANGEGTCEVSVVF